MSLSISQSTFHFAFIIMSTPMIVNNYKKKRKKEKTFNFYHNVFYIAFLWIKQQNSFQSFALAKIITFM